MAKKMPLNAKTLKVQKTPDPKRARKPITQGKKHGMGVTAFMMKLLQMNEVTLPRNRKMTDSEILRQVKMEYPGIRGYESTKKIRKTRSEYNRGELIPSIGPPKRELVSFPYNEEGDAINTRFCPPKVLTDEAKDIIRDKYNTKWRLPWEKKNKR